MLVSSFNLSQSFNYTPYLFYKKTVQIRDRFFLYMDHELSAWEEGKARTHEINIKKGYARNVINKKQKLCLKPCVNLGPNVEGWTYQLSLGLNLVVSAVTRIPGKVRTVLHYIELL